MLNGDEIEVNIITIGTSEIQYKKASNPDGPTFTTSRNKVFFIKFEDGTKEIITDISKQSQTDPNTNSTANALSPYEVNIAGLPIPNDITPPIKRFPHITIFPRATVGYHTSSPKNLDWSGLYWATDINALFPAGNNSAGSFGIGVMGLGGDIKNNLYRLTDLKSMYITIPLNWWVQPSDWFMCGFGNRLEILVSESLDGNSLEDTFAKFRDSFLISAMITTANLDLGAQFMFNVCKAFKSEDIGWSPTIGIAITAGYRF